MTAQWGVRQVGDDYVEILKDEAEARLFVTRFDKLAELYGNVERHEIVRRVWVKA